MIVEELEVMMDKGFEQIAMAVGDRHRITLIRLRPTAGM